MRNSNRMIRINDEIQKELAQIIRYELKDPRIPLMTSVLKVDTTNDLKFCKVYVSILGTEKQKEEALEALKKSSSFVRKQVAQKVNLRNTPEFKFFIDNSIEYSSKICKIIDDINHN